MKKLEGGETKKKEQKKVGNGKTTKREVKKYR